MLHLHLHCRISVVLLPLLAAALVGCGGNDDRTTRVRSTSPLPAACAAPPPPQAAPTLPDGITLPPSTTVVSSSRSPAQVRVEAFTVGDPSSVATAYLRDATRPLLTVTTSSIANGVRLTISGPSAHGTMDITALCPGRVGILLLLRPPQSTGG